MTAIEKIKTNKLAYVQLCISELSKVPMYEFHYDYNKNKYDKKVRLSFKDTGSLVYKLDTENAYHDFSKNKEMFDWIEFKVKITKQELMKSTKFFGLL